MSGRVTAERVRWPAFKDGKSKVMVDEVHARLESALRALLGTEHEVDWALRQLASEKGTVLDVAHAQIVAAIVTLRVAASVPRQTRKERPL